jgi:hypothetical protein
MKNALNKIKRFKIKVVLIVMFVAISNSNLLAGSKFPKNGDKLFTYKGENYTMQWNSADDKFTITDDKNLLIADGKLQPVVTVRPLGKNTIAGASVGKIIRYEATNNQLQVFYGGVNKTAAIHVTLNFSGKSIWIEPIGYDTKNNEDVVSMNMFASFENGKLKADLHSSHYVMPNMTAGNVVNSIMHFYVQLNTTLSLGYAMSNTPGFVQGWGTPCHYFGGYTIHHNLNEKKVATQSLSNGYCIGLAELPNADFWMDIRNDNISPQFSYRSDLWGNKRGVGHHEIGSKFMIAIGANYYEAIRQYYKELMAKRIILSNASTSSAHKKKVLLTPTFCTWGEQKAVGIYEHGTTDEILNGIYDRFRKSGMKSGTVIVDDKWENEYGSFEHSETKLPHFQEFVDKVHKDSLMIGMWTAFLRCEHPEKYGLTVANMLHKPNGEPFLATTYGRYYFFDVSQPEVQKVIRQQAKKFMKRYHPDVVKLDYMYEVSPLNMCAPKDMKYGGEKFLEKALEILVGAFREENPDIVTMYYHVSPLLNKYVDLVSLDDLCLAPGDEDLEANRRVLFSSLMGEVGVPTYGSSGYEWKSAPEIWFDAAVSGTVGSLQSFRGDEMGDSLSPYTIAKFNGLGKARRTTTFFHIEPLDCNFFSVAHGTHSSSWARYENDKVVLLALRNYRLDGPGGGVKKFKNLVETNTSVFLVSGTDDAIGKSDKLSIVPYGNGKVDIRCQKESGNVFIKEHLLGGRIVEHILTIQNGLLSIPVRESISDNEIVEWMEVVIE